MRRSAILVVVLALFAGTTGAGAHHGYAEFYDPADRTMAVDGVLEDLAYANPHVVMTIRTADGSLYRTVWQAASWVDQAPGATATTFRVGDRRGVVGAPALDPQDRTLTRLREVHRPADGWRWVSQQPFAPPG
jgi:hypothetical protein